MLVINRDTLVLVPHLYLTRLKTLVKQCLYNFSLSIPPGKTLRRKDDERYSALACEFGHAFADDAVE